MAPVHFNLQGPGDKGRPPWRFKKHVKCVRKNLGVHGAHMHALEAPKSGKMCEGEPGCALSFHAHPRGTKKSESSMHTLVLPKNPDIHFNAILVPLVPPAIENGWGPSTLTSRDQGTQAGCPGGRIQGPRGPDIHFIAILVPLVPRPSKAQFGGAFR